MIQVVTIFHKNLMHFDVDTNVRSCYVGDPLQVLHSMGKATLPLYVEDPISQRSLEKCQDPKSLRGKALDCVPEEFLINLITYIGTGVLVLSK